MNTRFAIVAILLSLFVHCSVGQMANCTVDTDCGSEVHPRGFCVNGFCSCASGFGGANCSSRPSDECSFGEVSATEGQLSVTPSVVFEHPDLTITIDVNMQESDFANPAENDSFNDLPYSAQTYLIFGNGSFPDCDFPNGGSNGVNWNDLASSSPSCIDRYSAVISWTDAKEKCGFEDPEGDSTFTQTVTVIRSYKLSDLRSGQPVARNESSTHVLSITFPTEIGVTSSNTAQVTGEIDVLSAITKISYSPSTDKWSLQFATSVQAPFVLQNPSVSATTGLINTNNRYEDGSLVLSTLIGCNNNTADCQQQTGLSFVQGGSAAACDALSGSVTVKYDVNCAEGLSENCPLFGNETAELLLTLSTGSSCPASDQITFSVSTLSSYADDQANIPKTSFITNQLGYFAAVVQSDNGQIATKQVKSGSVCFQIGSDDCETVNITTLPANGIHEPIFSVNFEENSGVFGSLTQGPNEAQTYSVHAVIQVTFTGANKKRNIPISFRKRQSPSQQQEVSMATNIGLQTPDAATTGSLSVDNIQDNSANSMFSYLFIAVLALFCF